MPLARVPRVRLANLPAAPERTPRPSGGPGIDLRTQRGGCTGTSWGGDEAGGSSSPMAEAAGDDVATTRGAGRRPVEPCPPGGGLRRAAGRGSPRPAEDRAGSDDPARDGSGDVLPGGPHGAIAGTHPGGAVMAVPTEASAEDEGAKGRDVHVIPGGAVAPVAPAGAMGPRIDRIVRAAGSAGTRAGPVAQLAAIDAGIPVPGVGSRATRPRRMVHDPAVKVAGTPGRPGAAPREDGAANTDGVGEGCGLPAAGTLAAIRPLARPEEIQPDPVRSGEGADGSTDPAPEHAFAGGPAGPSGHEVPAIGPALGAG